MAEIGVERLGAGDGEEHRAKRHQPDGAVGGKKADGVGRIERGEHPRVVGDMREA